MMDCDAEKIYIVTGATGGIGQALVDGLVRRRVSRIVLACRNIRKAEKIIEKYSSAETELTAMALDLESFSSVRAFAQEISDRNYFVKALINNAGTMPGEVHLTVDGYESATQTNFLATMLLTELIMPRFVAGTSVIFTTSMTRRIAKFHENWDDLSKRKHNRFVTYGRSKKMLTAYALMLSERLSDKKITVNCSDPWIVDSGIICMGNKVIDSLSSALFRPLIYTPEQGAASVFTALDSCSTGQIFTRHNMMAIPRNYIEEKPQSIIKQAFYDITEK